MKQLNVSLNPLISTPTKLKEVVDTFMQERARYISRLQVRGRDCKWAVTRLLPPILARAEAAGIEVDNKTKGKLRDYLGCLYFSLPVPRDVGSKRKSHTFVHLTPVTAEPTVSMDCDAEVGPLWTQAIEILNKQGMQLDDVMAQAIINHRFSLPNKEREDYVSLTTAEVWMEMAAVNTPTYWDYSGLQLSGRLTPDDRGAGAGSKWSRIIFQTAECKKVNARAKKFFAGKLEEMYGVTSPNDWSGRVINAYDITTQDKAKELNHALAWFEICAEGKTRRTGESDAHNSGMKHMELQTGNWRHVDIDASMENWVKSYVHICRKLRLVDPWICDLSLEELLVFGKTAMSSSQYGGGPYAIASLYFKDLKYDRDKETWQIPSKAYTQIPEIYYDIFETQIYEGDEEVELQGVVLPIPVLDHMANGLDRFVKEVLKKHYRAFDRSFPWVSDLNEAMIAWGEEHAGQVIEYPDGFTRRISRWKEDEMHPTIKLTLYDKDGYKHPTGVLPLKDSEFTETMSLETHHLDALQMVLMVIKGDKDGVDLFPIWDAACVNIADWEWLENTASEIFIEIHKTARFPVGTEKFKPWTGPLPTVWGV